jgi:hypothetical protein
VVTIAVLFAMTGSLVLRLKQIAMNALGLAALFGILVLIFQQRRPPRSTGTERRMRRFHLAAIALAVASLATGASAASASATPIATVTTSDFRVVVTAEKTGSGSAPTATVRVITSKRSGRSWRRTGAHRLGGSYFWNTVTGPHAVCRLDIRTSSLEARARPYVVVQLLLTPALGCGAAQRFALV